jgi:hypothetical protein
MAAEHMYVDPETRGQVRAVFLVEVDEQVLLRDMLSRGRGFESSPLLSNSYRCEPAVSLRSGCTPKRNDSGYRRCRPGRAPHSSIESRQFEPDFPPASARSVGSSCRCFMPAATRVHGRLQPSRIHGAVGRPVQVQAVVLVHDYIARNHWFGDECHVRHLERYFPCTVVADASPTNGPKPDSRQVGVELLDLSGMHSSRLF